MAGRFASLCRICSKIFNKLDRKAVPLPCGHSFCSSCLNRLIRTGCRKCFICRKDWTDVDTKNLAGKEAIVSKTAVPDYIKTWRGSSIIVCKKHCQPYLYWCEELGDIFCKKCLALHDDSTSVAVIEDAIPDIKRNFNLRGHKIKENLQNDLEELENRIALVSQKLLIVKKFKDKIDKLEREFVSCLKDLKSNQVKRTTDAGSVKKVVLKVEKINSRNDLLKIENCRDILVDLSRKTAVMSPSLEEMDTLLFDIASSYMSESSSSSSRHDNQEPSTADFIRNLLKDIDNDNHYNTEHRTTPSTSDSNNNNNSLSAIALSAQCLKENERWLVDNSNCLGAVCALALRKPSLLTIISRDDTESLPPVMVAALIKGARDCEVWLRFLDSFYHPNVSNASRDLERLEHIMQNRSIRVTRLFGGLEVACAAGGGAVSRLGVSISSARDAVALNRMKTWSKLTGLHVSIAPSVPHEALRPLPDVEDKRLHFYGLTDARVASVRPAIEALVPDKRFTWLFLPKCELSQQGVLRLTKQLHGLRIESVTIDASLVTSTSWSQDPEVRNTVARELRNSVKCFDVRWSMTWIYE